MRAITKGNKKIDSAAKTIKMILEKEEKEVLENWIIFKYWFPVQDRNSFRK